MAATVTKFQKKYRVKKGDKVIVITGKDKGKEGEIVRIIKENDRAIVSGANIVSKNQKPGAEGNGGIIKKEASIHISNLALVDAKTGGRTKVGYQTLKDGKKVRVAKKSGEVIA